MNIISGLALLVVDLSLKDLNQRFQEPLLRLSGYSFVDF